MHSFNVFYLVAILTAVPGLYLHHHNMRSLISPHHQHMGLSLSLFSANLMESGMPRGCFNLHFPNYFLVSNYSLSRLNICRFIGHLYQLFFEVCYFLPIWTVFLLIYRNFYMFWILIFYYAHYYYFLPINHLSFFVCGINCSTKY